MHCGTISLPGSSICYRAVLVRLAAIAIWAIVFVDAVIWKFRVGTLWRDLPERFGGWCNTHKRFSRWAVSGVWENLFKVLADDPDNEYAMIDATIVRAHQHSAGAHKKGGSIKPSAARAAGSRRKST